MTYEARKYEWTTPRGRPFVSLCRDGTNDWNTTHAICADDEYGLAERHVDGWAVDIGAYLGTFSICVALDNPKATVVAIEPIPENADLIRRNVSLNELGGRIEVMEAAAGLGEGRIRYGYAGSDLAEHHAFVGNITLLPGHEARHDIQAREITAAWLIALCGDVDLMKIDCEGAEWSILQDEAVARARLIIGEWHPQGRGTREEFRVLAERWGGSVTLSGLEQGPGHFELRHE